MLLLTLRGTPTLYYGDEIGMVEVELPREVWRDPQGLRGGRTRDGCRTPMRWDGSALAGFTTGTPWLPLDQPAGTDVATQRDDPTSMLALYRTLLRLRRAEPALNVGEWLDLGRTDSTIAYMRSTGQPGGTRFLICLNLTSKPSPPPPAATSLRGEIMVSTLATEGRDRFEGRRGLAADEGLVIRLD